MSSALARQWDFYDEEEDLDEEGLTSAELELEADESDAPEYDHYDAHYEAQNSFAAPPVPLGPTLALPAAYSQPFSYNSRQLAAPRPTEWDWFGANQEHNAVYAYTFRENAAPRQGVTWLDSLLAAGVQASRSRLLVWLAVTLGAWLFLSTSLTWLSSLGHSEPNIYDFGGMGGVAAANTTTEQKQAAPPAVPGANSVEGKPSISVAKIEEVLRQYNSPAVGKGQALYDLGLKYGIDPAYPLAFFVHESTAGTKGVAVTTKSIGNIRQTNDSGFEGYQGFRKYPTWEAGMEDWYKLIKNLYINAWGLRTVETIIPKYAPAADRNNPPAYINQVVTSVNNWRNGK